LGLGFMSIWVVEIGLWVIELSWKKTLLLRAENRNLNEPCESKILVKGWFHLI
jgi:hypothetical protein